MNVNKFELILVDDDSTDRTHEILINLKKRNNFVRYFIRKKKEEIYHNHVFMVLIKLNMRI
jgi:glycosyltransferase involved in cell wall biosynthesis